MPGPHADGLACKRARVPSGVTDPQSGRRRMRRAVVCGIAVVLLAAGCTSMGHDRSSSSDQHAASAGNTFSRPCPPPPKKHRTTSAAQLNQGVSRAKLPGWQAADIGASTRLPDGRIVWLFGDTVRDKSFDPLIVANSMLVSSGPCVTQLMTPTRGPVIPDVATNIVRWPMSVVVGRSGGHSVIVVLCAVIDRGNSGSLGFTYLGSSAAVFTVKPDKPPQLQKVTAVTPVSRNSRQVNWGAAASADGRWYYVYGTQLPKNSLGRALYVARIPAVTPTKRKTYRFWDGHHWQPDVHHARPVIPASGGVSQTLTVDAVNGDFVAVSKRGGDVANFIYKWTAPHAWGPWVAQQELPAPAGFDTGKLKYMPLAHPEVRLSSGNLLVSVSRNTTDLKALLANPKIGRPYFVEVPLG